MGHSSRSLEKLAFLSQQFLKKPKKRKGILRKIEALTEAVCADEKIISYLKIKAQERLDLFHSIIIQKR